MSITRKFYLLCFLYIICLPDIFCQVQQVNYQIKYNKSTCLYDCCIIIKEGTARTALQRAQFSSQYSIVVPTGSEVSIVANRMPLQNNQNYAGTQPTIWNVGSVIFNPASLPGSDIYGITPTLAPASFYNNLNLGDTVALFSLRINPTVVCGNGIRPFENGIDPGSGAAGMEGGDFSNGFTLGGVSQKYSGNQPTVKAPKPKVQLLETSCATGLEINLQATTQMCQLPLSYEWTGPDAYHAVTKDVRISNTTPFSSGTYSVKITDSYGCSDTFSIAAYAKPKAGTDQYVRCYSTGVATITAEGAGTWTIGQGSSGTATIENDKLAVTRVTDFNSAGLYYLIWSTVHCKDTVIINAGNNCGCNITNSVILPNEHSYCTNTGNILLIGNVVSGNGTYRWITSKNGSVYQNAAGINSTVNYQIDGLTAGQYRYRRIFNTQGSLACSDTSNIVYINVVNRPDAGSDITLNCPAADTAFLHSPDAGYWAIGQGSAGNIFLSAITPQSVYITSFSSAGQYHILRSNYVCADTMVVLVNDLCGCDVANAGPDRNKCAGDTLQLSGSCRIGKWLPISGNPAGAAIDTLGNGKAIIYFTNTAAGSFQFVYAINNLLFDTISVIVHSIPVIDAGQDFGFCSDQNSGPIILTASGGTSYIWSTGQSSNSINVNPLQTSVFGVKGYDIYGCSASDSITISVYVSPQGAAPVIPPVYEYEPLMLNAGPWQNAVTYLWTGPNNFVANQPVAMITNAAMENDGMYTLTITSRDDCTVYMNVPVHVVQRPLSVSVLSFRGFWDERTSYNALFWHSGPEMNAEYFVVERLNLFENTFVPMAKMDAVATDGYYTFKDKDIISGGTYFYRIQIVKPFGKVQYSDILRIETMEKHKAVEYLLYPNPAKDEISLFIDQFPEDIAMDLKVFNSQGSEVFFKRFSSVESGLNLMSGFHADQMSPGVYVVRLSFAQKVINVRFSIVK